ncbi:ammonium transporter [Waterburya agarophytonicola K14]|uniref:Ammonium transporter n=1 Tax=Waterburya agarophytonicola KI4 TaxID=2874699 RepID=A0A964BTV6_9CYAN|nr:ammonium transporter [Waterburya agarophytonicola]MCC0179370.1 ammonium transporter [Waterburya agarophytonicola KI4]
MTINQLWVLLCTGLVFLMQAGFMCLESGLTRAKNSINVAVKNIADFGISVALFWVSGYGMMFGISRFGWFGTSDFFPSAQVEQSFATVFFLYQAMFCGTATTIISGAVAERLKFSAYIVIAILVSGIIYPLFGHWAWNDGGWLKQLGFIDFAGSTVVHSVGALVSLATLIIIGSRQGRFDSSGKARKIQGTNLPFAVLGALLLWVGWLGFNGGSTLELNEQVPGIILNTVMAGVGGMITAILYSQWRYRRIEAEELINGSIAGLVAITACCNIVATPLAVIIGATGAMVAQLVSQTLRRWRIDDAVDAVAIHGGAGIWGTLCVALFGQLELINTGLNRLSQLGIQLLGVTVACIWAFGFSWLLLKLLNSFFVLRVSLEDEELGLNVSEHDAKTDTYELFQVMDLQARTHDLSLRVPVESFTENGHIATRYNQMMDALQKNHQQTTESLEELYAVTATVISAVENSKFSAADFDSFASRSDELGILARVLQQIVETINSQQGEIAKIEQKLEISVEKQQSSIVKTLETRFGDLPQTERDRILSIQDLEQLNQLFQKAIAIDSLEDLDP